MSIVSSQRIRFSVDCSEWQQTPTDIITGTNPKIANGSDVAFELAFSYGVLISDSQLASMTNWSSVTVSLKDDKDINGNAYWSVVIPNASLNGALAYASWASGTAQHCVAQVTNAQNSLIISGPNSQATYWLVIQINTSPVTTLASTSGFSGGVTSMTMTDVVGSLAVGQSVSGTGIATGTTVTSVAGTIVGLSLPTTGSSGGVYTLVSSNQFPAIGFPVTVVDVGIPVTSPAFITPASYFTKGESDARYAVSVNLGSYAPLAGATFTGPVIHSSTVTLNADPASDLQAATKRYVDISNAAAAASAEGLCVSIAGVNAGWTAISGAKTFTATMTVTAGLTVSGGSASISPTVAATTTASFASGVTSIIVTSATGIAAGQVVSGTGIPDGTTVTSIASAPTIVISSATTAPSGGSYTFTPPALSVNGEVAINGNKVIDGFHQHYDASGNRVLGAQQAAIANDASGSSNQAKVNAILAALRSHGIIST